MGALLRGYLKIERNKMDAWQFIHNKLSVETGVALLYVLKSEGSSPGRQGFKMAVAADGTFCGTIGGGIMEHKFVEMAKAELQLQVPGAGIYKQVHNKTAAKNQSGMICSGEQTIFLYHMKNKDLEAVHTLTTSLRAHRNGCLKLTKDGIFFSPDIPSADYFFEQSEDDFLLVEKTGYKNRLHLIGGGHCALALSKLMHELDFYVNVYDERVGLNTIEQNNFAHQTTVLDSYADLAGIISGGDNEYVVIMTFGYRSDDVALRAILNKQFKYLGMLGSKNKVEKMFAQYASENINLAALKNIRSPVGIQIKSQTAVEIAVSIAAEIIACKNINQ